MLIGGWVKVAISLSERLTVAFTKLSLVKATVSQFGSGGGGRVVEVLRVGAEVRAEHEARVDHPEELVAEAVHRVLDAGAGGFVEVEEPRAAAGPAGLVAQHAE